MRKFLIILPLLLLIVASCQKDDVEPIGLGNYNINMCDGSTTLRNGKTYHFYDSGGPYDKYRDNEEYSYKFRAPQGKRVKMTFESFNTENNFDYLKVNGSATKYTGNYSPGTVYSVYDSLGYQILTVRFHSDGGITHPGWSAKVTAVN